MILQFNFLRILDKVLPYEEILPKKLYKDLLKTYLSLAEPDSKPIDKAKPRATMINIDSKIIKYQHAELILKWINRLEITNKLSSLYDFKLLFRGVDIIKFHQFCDKKSRTVTVVKVKGSDEILGGYNPIEWRSDNKYGITKDSFIFSFKNNDGIEGHILSRVTNENYAIHNGQIIGPSFGDDLIIWGGNKYEKRYYEKPIRNTTDHFYVEECEVFQIVG
jgi:hypothetical protein